MYLKHFGLDCPPFKITPNPDFFYSGANRGAILDALLYAITSGEGIVKVVGEVGSGKTMLCRMLETRLPKNVEIIYIANPSLNREEIFHAIAADLNIATAGRHAGEVLRAMQDYLIEKHVAGKQVVILIEEAQAMPLETLEEVRLLSNLETSHHKLLQIVLFGQPELDDNLNKPQMRQLKERIIHSFWVPPMTGKDIPDYLMFRMRAAGYRGPDIFSWRAVRLLIKASGGITRRINILADKALLAVFAENQYNVLPRHVEAAIADSEFSPPPEPDRFSNRMAILTAFFLTLGAIIALTAWLKAPQPIPPPPSHPANAAPSPSVAVKTPASKPPTHEPRKFLEKRLEATNLWMRSTDPNRFTVQLMLAGTDPASQQKIESFLDQAADEIGIENFYVYRGNTPNGVQIGILYGSYPNTAEAYAALGKLPEKFRVNGALLRTLKGVQARLLR